MKFFPMQLRLALPAPHFCEEIKNNTYKKFGPLIGKAYKFEDGIRDKVIVPLVYEGRIIPQDVSNKKIDDYLKYILEPLNEEQREDMRRKWSRFFAPRTNQATY
jgi:type I restriction enzyme R subunit